MKTINLLGATVLLTVTITSLSLAQQKTEPEVIPLPEPCLVEGECEVVHDAHFDWGELKDGRLENKMFINPTFTGKLAAVELTNVVFLNGRLGTVDLSAGAVLNGVVFRGNQIASLNFNGAKLSRVVVEGNLKQQPVLFGSKEEKIADAIPLNLRDAIVRDSIFVNNVILVKANKNTVIHRTSFIRNNMLGSLMQGAKIDKSDFSGNDVRDSDLRFGSATGVKIVNNQVHGVKYPKGRKGRVAIYGNWANNPVKEWEYPREKKLDTR